MRKLNLVIKRIIDIIASVVGLILLMPLFIIIAVLIKLTSKGPVFFRQKRLGKKGIVFKIYKFRTMIDNAEKLGDGIHITKNDDRITSIGRILRKYSLDELPQLINVLRGEMSLVGPRPLLTNEPKEYSMYTSEEKIRFMMKPGITGLAQINGRSLTWEEKFVYDKQYVENFSLIMDLKILIRTIGQVIFPKNIYKDEKNNE